LKQSEGGTKKNWVKKEKSGRIRGMVVNNKKKKKSCRSWFFGWGLSRKNKWVQGGEGGALGGGGGGHIQVLGRMPPRGGV